MKFITVSELRLKATQIVAEIEETGKGVIVTKKGKPVVVMTLFTEEAYDLKKDQGKGVKSGKRNL